jgi:histidine triad (HIT) family protein
MYTKIVKMGNCIFCKIIKNELPSYKIYEDENILSFLTINPTKKGHVLVIPKKHDNYFFDLEDQELSELVIKAKPIASALKKVFKPKSGKVALSVMGIGVPHVHLHLIPMDSEQDINAENTYHASAQELEEVAILIKSALQ